MAAPDSSSLVNTGEIRLVYNNLIYDATEQLNTLLTNGKITGTQYAEILSAQMATAMQLSVTSVQQQPVTTAQATEIAANTVRQDKANTVQVAMGTRDIAMKETQIAQLTAQKNEVLASTIRNDKTNTAQIVNLTRDAAMKEAQIDQINAQKKAVDSDRADKAKQAEARTAATMRQSYSEQAKTDMMRAEIANKAKMTEASLAVQFRQAKMLEAQTKGFEDNLRIKQAQIYGETLGMAATQSGAVSSEQWSSYANLIKNIEPDSFTSAVKDQKLSVYATESINLTDSLNINGTFKYVASVDMVVILMPVTANSVPITKTILAATLSTAKETYTTSFTAAEMTALTGKFEILVVYGEYRASSTGHTRSA